MDGISIFWTGGWDSTYRVLDALLSENLTVHPYYIVDPTRQSVANEITAMTRIRHHFRVNFPVQANRLMPTEMIHLEDIQPDEQLSTWFRQLKSKTHIGSQYEWLAKFAKYNDSDLELCITSSDNSELFSDFIRPLLKRDGHDCKIEGPFPVQGIQLFMYFRFPLINKSKAEMRARAEKEGFIDIMKLTWFCHKPKKGFPCGKCRPCLRAPATGEEYTFYQPTVRDKIHDVLERFL
jgi:hypothetical protein